MRLCQNARLCQIADSHGPYSHRKKAVRRAQSGQFWFELGRGLASARQMREL
jgi:hypothetical protein